MGAVTLVALASGKQRAALPSLCAGVLGLLLVQPGLARDAGFALSVAATAAIVLLARPWSRALRRRGLPTLLADALAVSAAAGVATTPLIAGLNGRIGLVSLPANLLAAPAVAPATVLGLLAALASPVSRAAADALVWVAGWPVRWLVGVAEHGAALPDAVVAWPVGAGPAIGLTGVLLGAAVLLWRFAGLRPLALAALVGLVLLGWPLRQAVHGWPPAAAVVVACDVGPGDALVVPTGDGEGLLVDTGPDVSAVDRCLTDLGIDRLPMVLLSHLDADHAGGLAGALAGRQVDAVATGTLSPADHRAGPVDRLAAAAGAHRETVVPGERRRVGDAALEVLAPPPEIATSSAAPNDLSVVARVRVRGLRVLFTGDLGAEAEARILDRGVDLRADVLKVPHHGSADVDPDFLAATGARVALVSVGASNDYGHPTAYTLRLLAREGMRIDRTDRGGDLAVVGGARDWGVAAHGAARVTAAPRDGAPAANAPAPAGERRRRVTPCRRARCSGRTHLPAARGRGGGGAAAGAGRRRRPHGGARTPPRRRGARAAGPGAPGRPARRRARPLPVRRAPAGAGRRRPGRRHRARRRPDRLRQGSRPGPDPGDRALGGQAQRGPAQGLPRRRRRRRRLPEDHLTRRPGGFRAQRGPLLRRSHHPRRADRAGGRRRQRPAAALLGGQPARLRLRRHDRRRRRRPVPPRPGRGHRLHGGREGAGRGPAGCGGVAALGAGPRGRARAHRRCHRRRCPHRRPGGDGAQQQPRRPRPRAEDAAVEGQESPVAGPRLEHRRAAAGDRRRRRAQRRRQGRRRQCRLRPGAGGAPHRADPRRDRSGARRPRPVTWPERSRAPVPAGTGALLRGRAGGQPCSDAYCLAMPDLRFAAWFLWMTPLAAALSSCLLATCSAVAAASAFPASAAVRKRRTAVFRADLTATLRCRRRSLVLFRLIWDLMFATREPRCLEGNAAVHRPGARAHADRPAKIPASAHGSQRGGCDAGARDGARRPARSAAGSRASRGVSRRIAARPAPT